MKIHKTRKEGGGDAGSGPPETQKTWPEWWSRNPQISSNGPEKSLVFEVEGSGSVVLHQSRVGFGQRPKGPHVPLSLSLSLSLSLGVWAAPAAPPTIPEGGGAKPPHLLEWVFGAAGAAQTPTNRRFPAGPKTMCFILRKLAREIESRAPKNSKLKSGPESKSIRSFDSGSGGPGGHGRPPEPIRRASGALPGKTWDPPRTWAKTPMSQT